MQTTDLTRTRKEMNHYWRLLAAFTNEVDMALRMGELTPEQRMAKIAELVTFARSQMAAQVPPDVLAEDRAGQAETAQQTAAPEAQEPASPLVYYTLQPDGTFAGPFPDDAEDQQLTPEEEAIMRREGWGE